MRTHFTLNIRVCNNTYFDFLGIWVTLILCCCFCFSVLESPWRTGRTRCWAWEIVLKSSPFLGSPSFAPWLCRAFPPHRRQSWPCGLLWTVACTCNPNLLRLVRSHWVCLFPSLGSATATKSPCSCQYDLVRWRSLNKCMKWLSKYTRHKYSINKSGCHCCFFCYYHVILFWCIPVQKVKDCTRFLRLGKHWQSTIYKRCGESPPTLPRRDTDRRLRINLNREGRRNPARIDIPPAQWQQTILSSLGQSLKAFGHVRRRSLCWVLERRWVGSSRRL